MGTALNRTLLIFPAILLASFGLATSFDDYLKQRKRLGISQATSVAALETMVGERVLEIKGIVKGTFRANGKTSLLLERTDGQTEIIESVVAVDWLHGNEIPARLLVKAVRPTETDQLRASLLAAAPEARMASYELAQSRLAKKQPKSTKPISGAVRVASGPKRDWNLPASEVTPHYARFIQSQNKRLNWDQAMEIATGIVGFSIQYGVDARLIMAMVMTESTFNPNVVSRSGARGLGQLMPGTAAGLGVRDSFDINQNLWGTVRLVRGHLDKYRKQTGDSFNGLVLSLAAYNAGSGAVRRHGGVPPYRETQNYVRKVIALYNRFCGR
jgi:soluble lytic murein transglycosylase-like protein